MKKSDFPHKLGKWITKEIPVEKIDIDPETGVASKATHIEKLKVKYMDVPRKKHRCKEGEHIFRVLDKSRYIFGCKRCQYSRQVYPGVYRLTSKGHLIHVETNKRI